MNIRRVTRSKLKPIILTDRDRDILGQVAKYRVLSTDQLQALCFPSVHRARKRLRALWLHGYLKRHERPVRMGLGSSQALYSSTPKGQALVPQDSGQEPFLASKLPLSEHSQAITQFRVIFETALKRFPGLKVALWRQDRGLGMTAEIDTNKGGKKVVVLPDALFAFRVDGRDYCYCLEIDRGSTDLGRIQTKLLAYLQIWQDRIVTAKFGFRSFRLLFVTTSAARARRILDRLSAPIFRNRRLDVLLVATFDDYSLQQPAKLIDSIWQTLDANLLTVSVCPFPVSLTSKLPTAPGKPPVRGPDAGC